MERNAKCRIHRVLPKDSDTFENSTKGQVDRWASKHCPSVTQHEFFILFHSKHLATFYYADTLSPCIGFLNIIWRQKTVELGQGAGTPPPSSPCWYCLYKSLLWLQHSGHRVSYFLDIFRVCTLYSLLNSLTLIRQALLANPLRTGS